VVRWKENEMPKTEGYRICFIADGEHPSEIIIGEPDEAKARAHVAAKCGEVPIVSCTALDGAALMSKSVEPGGSMIWISGKTVPKSERR
jgi:hypothetical protein